MKNKSLNEIVKNPYESDGDLSAISSKTANQVGFKTFASNFTYTASGVIDKLQIGNGRWEVAKFNERQQVTEMSLGTSPTDTSLWKINYEYGEIDSSGNVDISKNTGNVAKQTISFTGLAQPFIQTYKYDSLYRITEAKETNNNSQTWKQTWNYDRYGNRLAFSQFSGTTQLTLDNKTFPQIDSSTNRFTDTQTFNYDKNGNLTKDGESRAFTFNGENKQTEIKDANGVSTREKNWLFRTFGANGSRKL